jgi:hypothetical protein
MATTYIELDIENITGVSDADDQFIISAQKFVVSSVPKNLLKWASSETAAASHGGDSSPTAITLPVGTDNIISVRRGSYPAYEVPIEDSPYISDSNSLKLATSKFPKYWLDPANKVQIKPAPSDSVTAHVQYIDFSKLDDDSDLRNAIIFHACAKEFTKLSSDVIPDWSDVTVPIAPTSPDFGNDLSITSVAPSVPTISTVSYSDASNSDATVSLIGSVTVSSVNKADISGDVPTYTKPGVLIGASAPSVPSITTVSFTDPGLSITAVEPSAVSLTTVNYQDASQTSVESLIPPIYSGPTLGSRTSFEDWWNTSEDSNPFGDNDPGDFSVSAVVPVAPSAPSFSTPAVADVTVASLATAPVYTAPKVGGVTEELTATMDADSSGYGTEADFLDFSKWFSIAGEFIEDEEDTELAASQLGKIQAYVQAYQSAMQNQLNVFNDANVEYQADIQKKITDAQIGAQDAQSTANLLLEKESKEYIQKLSKYQNELNVYQAEVQKEVQEYGQKLSRYQLEMGTAYTAWVETENRGIKRFQAELSDAQADYQSRATEFQGELQKKITDAQEANKIALQNKSQEARDAIENNNAALAKYGSESQNYSANIQKGIQSYNAELQSAGQTMQAIITDNQAKMSKYSNELKSFDSQIKKEMSVIQADIQNELNEFNKENVRYQANVQAELAKHQSDLQKVLTQAQLNAQDSQQEAALITDLDKFNKAQDQALALANAAKQIEDVIADNGSKIQKYSAELQAYQAEVGKEVQNYSNTLSKEVQEYQSKLAMYTADLQKYQAEVTSETQKTALNSQKAQLYEAEANKYYQWAVAEVQTYVQNNSKMIGMTMAAQAAQQ